MAQVLLLGKDWQARALLRAQLREDGIEVEAHESAREANLDLESKQLMPELAIADLASSDDPDSEIELLAAWARHFPVWVIAHPTLIVNKSLKGRGFEMILLRPIDVGELVEQIKRRVEA